MNQTNCVKIEHFPVQKKKNPNHYKIEATIPHLFHLNLIGFGRRIKKIKSPENFETS